MERKEIIECLEQLQLEETVFNRQKESKALRVAIRVLKNETLKKAIFIGLAAAGILAAAWIGFTIGIDAANM